MTTHEIELLKEWFMDKFEHQNSRLSSIESRQGIADQKIAAIEGQMQRFSEVVDRLDALAESMDVVSRFVQRGKRAWLKLAGYAAAVIVIGNWIAAHMPDFSGWFS